MAENANHLVVSEQSSGFARLWTLRIISSCLLAGAIVAVVVMVIQSVPVDDLLLADDLIVTTDCGPVAGELERSESGKNVAVYMGIPYAKPPIGSRRWNPPEDLDRDPKHGRCWQGILKATMFGSLCAQSVKGVGSGLLGSEDCLTLNIWTTNVRKRPLLPVLVWIHGGDLLYTSPQMKHPLPWLDIVHNAEVVIVTINYRLNAFGFLALDVLAEYSRNNASGNYGLMDQIQGLKWVKRNIQEFGGDPDRITLMGHGGGGKAVYALVSSPKASHMISGAIVQSAPAMLVHSDRQAAKMNAVFIRRANCTRPTKREIWECLYKLSAEQVIQSIPWFEYPFWSSVKPKQLPVKGHFDAPLCVVEPAVVPSSPYDLPTLRKSELKPVPILVTTTAQETERSWAHNLTQKSLLDLMRSTLGTFSSTLPDQALKLYELEYGNHSLWASLIYVTMSTDIRSTCPTNYLLKKLAALKGQSIFQMVIDTKPSKPLRFRQGPKYFAFHGWDLLALFNFTLPSADARQSYTFTPTKRDLKFRDDVISEIFYFIHHGKPMSTNWFPYPFGVAVHKNGRMVYHYGDYHWEYCDFWQENGLKDYGWVL